MNKNSFVIELPSADRDPNGFYKKGLINLLTSDEYTKLTVAGMDKPFYTNTGKEIRGIDYAGPGKVITIGTAQNHDVNWIDRVDFAREKGYNPVYDLISDWKTITKKLDVYYNEKYPKNYNFTGTYGANVQVFDGFVKIGDNIYPWENKTNTLSARDIEVITAQLYRLKR